METKSINIDMAYKIVILGECGTGKSSIAEKYVNDTYQSTNTSTIGVDFFNKVITLGNKTFKIQIWDTAGQEKFYNLIYSYFRDCCMAIIVFDITNRDTFNKIDFWVNKYETYSLEEYRKPFLLVGNKIDSPNMREVSHEEALNKAKDLECEYIECSAKENINIDDVFTKTINIIYSKILEGVIDPKKTNGIKLHSSIQPFYLHQEKPSSEKCCTIL